jgi:lysophospholipase L1-like esterase
MRRPVVRSLALVGGSALAVLAAEVALRISGRYSTYSERNYGQYRDVYGRTLPTWIHAREPGSSMEFRTAEFRHVYEMNSDGLRDLQRELQVQEGVQRIVVLGDSFTEGVGADRHEAWPAVLQDLLAQSGRRVEVLNAGVSASDPFFCHHLLRERMLRYAPDLVIVAINESDQIDTLWWGGMERFREDGTTVGPSAPLVVRAYGVSHLWRLVLHSFCGFDQNTMTFGNPVRRLWEAQLELIGAFEAMSALRVQQPFRLLVLTHPLPHAVAYAESGYYQAFHDRLAERGIASADLGEELRAQLAGLEADEFSWPIDKHYNARGYAAFARAVATVLEGSDPEGRPWLEGP